MVRSVVWLLITITCIQPLYGKSALSVASLEKEATNILQGASNIPALKRLGSVKDRLNRLSLSDVLKKNGIHAYLSSGNVGLNNKDKGWPLEKVTFDHPIQSPVDLVTSKAVTRLDLPPLDIIDSKIENKVQAKFYNSGHTVYVYINRDPSLRPYLTGGPLFDSQFIFEQMHFHWGSEDIWGSEHFVNGESYAVEIHLVHYNSSYGTFEEASKQPDGLSVLTLFAEAQDEDNPLLEPLHQLLPSISEAKTSVMLDAAEAMKWAASALTINNDYYTYPGSLTTEPYSQNVVFILLTTPIKLSITQLGAFRSLHSDHHDFILDNKRNLQPLHNRPIVRGTRINP